jgi:phosphonate transport system substrate-binding protein
MIPRRLFTILALATLLGACGKSTPGADGGTPGEIRFSVLSTESAQNMQAYWTPILADMQRKTGLKITPYFSSNYTLLIEAMRFRKTDAGWFSNRSGLEAVRRANAEVFARTFDPTGVDGYESVLIVPAKSSITLDKVLRCDRSLTLGMGDVLSTSGTLAPMTYLFGPKGVDLAKCFKLVRSGANHETNLFAVANGQLDVATNNTTALLLNREKGRHEADEVRVIWESPMLPEDPIIWRKDLDSAVKEKLRQFFLTYGQGDTPDAARERSYLNKVKIGGFKPADNNHLLPVREMEATSQWLEAKQGGDAAKIALAKQNLDAITAERMTLEARTRAPAAAQ